MHALLPLTRRFLYLEEGDVVEVRRDAIRVFDAGGDQIDLEDSWPASGVLALDRRSRMLYRGRQLFINGEAASVPAEPALRHLADARALACDDPRCARLSDEARSCLADWLDAGWLRYQP